MTQAYDGVPDDICEVESLWRSAADQNHHNAQLSYVQFAVMGRFGDCDAIATKEEMSRFLDAAGAQLYDFGGVSLDYLGGLLIANLRADLDNMANQ